MHLNILTKFISTNFVNKKKLTRSKNDNYSFITIKDKTLLKKQNKEFENKIIIDCYLIISRKKYFQRY